jgi:diaminohydroxyphosphoribosylaminopyrimidine deaminase / 5-amino-6-(5-phosphoribosylamino)uracil reductase
LPDEPAWPALRAARELLRAGPVPLAFVPAAEGYTCVGLEGADLGPATVVAVAADADPFAGRAPCTVLRYVGDGPVVTLHHGAAAPPAVAAPRAALCAALCAALRVYLPVLFGAATARRAGRSFVVGHVTQTLDGRIACENGQSQWIGNDADRRHAHRMRALLDGVLVGASTALTDDPQLTVRHVAGSDPRRIVLSGRGRVLREGAGLRVMTPPGCDVVVHDTHDDRAANDSVHVHRLGAAGDELEPSAVLASLRARGIHSIYLEGGASTLSTFLRAGAIDVLQVHIAPTILGSGVPSFTLPEVHHVQDGTRFRIDHATLDSHLLLTCWQI